MGVPKQRATDRERELRRRERLMIYTAPAIVCILGLLAAAALAAQHYVMVAIIIAVAAVCLSAATAWLKGRVVRSPRAK